MKSLRPGSYGGDVKRLQERLKEFGFYKAEISDYFDADTERALIDFQTDRGLEADGLPGPTTLHELGLLEPEPPNRQI